jgi:hypothetical protein
MLDFADAPRQETICNAQVGLASCCTSVTHGHTWMQDHFDTKKIKVLMDAIVLSIPSIDKSFCKPNM